MYLHAGAHRFRRTLCPVRNAYRLPILLHTALSRRLPSRMFHIRNARRLPILLHTTLLRRLPGRMFQIQNGYCLPSCLNRILSQGPNGRMFHDRCAAHWLCRRNNLKHLVQNKYCGYPFSSAWQKCRQQGPAVPADGDQSHGG